MYIELPELAEKVYVILARCDLAIFDCIPVRDDECARPTSGARMTERHYAHMQPDAVAKVAARNLPTFIRAKATVRRIR